MACKSGRSKLSAAVKLELYSLSGGYCQKPDCTRLLFVATESGRRVNLGECAHIVAASEEGPRGKVAAIVTDRDAFENIILLCPLCHKLIDDAPDDFPVDVVKNWKWAHQEKLRATFGVPAFSQHSDLARAVEELLRTNGELFRAYGPQCGDFRGVNDAAVMWKKRVVDTIIPNNRRIVELLSKNENLLIEAQIGIAAKFKTHAEGLEFNHLSGDKNASAPLFPAEMSEFFNIGKASNV